MNSRSIFDEQPSAANESMTICARNESRPLVGSSRNITGGFVISSVATLSRFISPPDIVFK